MTFITNSSNNKNSCHETQKNTCRRDCNGCQSQTSRKKSNCQIERHPSFQGCIELAVDKCRLAQKTKSSYESNTKLCDSPKLKRSPHGSKSALCGSQPSTKPKDFCGMPSSCCASHAPKLKKTPSASSSKMCATRKSSKQSMRGKGCGGDNWCDCRNMQTQKIDCDRKVCIAPGEGQYVRNEWWCDCRGVTKYTGKKLCVRPGPILPKGNLVLPDTALEGDTTYKTDYTGKYLPPRSPIIQQGSLHAKCGPMSSQTTQKVDYQPKPTSKRDPIYPVNNTFVSTNPMEGETTMMHDFQVPRGFIPSKSFRPIQACKGPQDPILDETTQKADYVDWHTRGPQGPFPWTPGNKFIYPTIPMVGDTTYKTDYTTNGMGDRRMPILPRGNGIGIIGNVFEGCTTYKHDYVPWECVNEYDYNAPQPMIKCYKLEGESPEDPDKKLWCYKSDDVCPYYPPKPIDGVLAGTTQYVVRPSEGEKPCVAPQPPFNTRICDSETQLRITCPPPAENYNTNISGCQNENSYSQTQPKSHYNSMMHETKDYNYSANKPCGSSKKETKNYNYDINQTCANTDYKFKDDQPCGTNNYNYSVNQPCRPSKQDTKNYNEDTNACGTDGNNYYAKNPCECPNMETKKYNANQTCANKDYKFTDDQPCGTNNYNYSLNQPCRPSKHVTKNYNKDNNQTCGTEGNDYLVRNPCECPKMEIKNYNTNQTCGSGAREQPTYAPFQECSSSRQEAKPNLLEKYRDPSCASTTQYKPKESCETSESKPYYSIGKKYDQNCACVTQPTSRFTTQEERVLTVHC